MLQFYSARDLLETLLTPDPSGLQFKPGDPYATIPDGSGLKFYNLHQTLNTSINALNSFTDIYLISSAKSGFVFFISFTSFFLTFISYNNLFTISCQACRLQLVACCLSLEPLIHPPISRLIVSEVMELSSEDLIQGKPWPQIQLGSRFALD